jgi:hypothetical protein
MPDGGESQPTEQEVSPLTAICSWYSVAPYLTAADESIHKTDIHTQPNTTNHQPYRITKY